MVQEVVELMEPARKIKPAEDDQDSDVPELITFSSGEAFFYIIPPAASYGRQALKSRAAETCRVQLLILIFSLVPLKL